MVSEELLSVLLWFPAFAFLVWLWPDHWPIMPIMIPSMMVFGAIYTVIWELRRWDE